MRNTRLADYLLSVPERVLRSATALAGGLLREIGNVALPQFVRRTRLYRSLVDSTLRFLIEQVGQVEGAYPLEEKLAEDFLLRRTAGNGLELIGVLTFRASPVWVMAALADLSGAGRQLIQEIAATLKQEGLLAPDADVGTVDQLLDALERTAGRVAEAVNTPPLDIKSLRREWTDIRREIAAIPAPNLPSPADVWSSWRQLTQEAARQERTVWELSSVVAFSAITRVPQNLLWLGKSAAHATRRTGELFAGALLDHYRAALGEIHNTGYLRYLLREYRPYLRAAAGQFSPKRVSLTQKVLRRNVQAILCCVVSATMAVAQPPAKPKPASGKRPAATAAKVSTALPPEVSAGALRSHVSFLASDALAGRRTPSPGLDIAAEYIAAQFRRLGLEPPSQAGYFQTSEASASISIGGRVMPVPTESITGSLPRLIHARLYKFSSAEALTKEQTSFRAILTTPDVAKQLQARRRELAPHVIIAVEGTDAPGGEGYVTFRDPELAAACEKLPEGRTEAMISFVPAGLKNVIGVLPGSDAKLRDQFVLVTAHYDHVGTRAEGEGDRIFNGANDNASGIASMIETAAALSTSRVKPKRSVGFVAFFGEENGLIGSRYYASNPVFPIDRTVAQINLEQTGRTDDSDGPRLNGAIITGFGFSELGAMLQKAAATAGIKVEDVPQADDFFNRSDNEALAAVGVPAHTMGVAFVFPDYHKPGDEWAKIDYDNMARVTRGIAAGTLFVANRADPPRWLTTNPKAEEFWRESTPLAKPREASAPKSGSSPANPKPRRSKP